LRHGVPKVVKTVIKNTFSETNSFHIYFYLSDVYFLEKNLQNKSIGLAFETTIPDDGLKQ